jgi:stage V sporulation protein SpoVS
MSKSTITASKQMDTRGVQNEHDGICGSVNQQIEANRVIFEFLLISLHVLVVTPKLYEIKEQQQHRNTYIYIAQIIV